MSTVERARSFETDSGWIPPEPAQKLCGEVDVPIEQLMLELIPRASEWSRPSVSGFEVGAVAQGVSGALFFGANCEFSGAGLSQIIHAEQAAVINAIQHREPGLQRLAVSAPPCGYCRQFLYELVGAEGLQIVLADESPKALTHYLPGAFGPRDLGVEGGLMAVQSADLEPVVKPEDELASAAVAAARLSYAPYTRSPGGVAVKLANGRVFTGSHLENAAFNPSISALRAAVVSTLLGGGSLEEMERVVISQLEGSKVNHVGVTRALLDCFAPEAHLAEVALRRSS